MAQKWGVFWDYGSHKLTKYCGDASLGYNGFTDNLTVLQSIDDAATANWGSEHRRFGLSVRAVREK